MSLLPDHGYLAVCVVLLLAPVLACDVAQAGDPYVDARDYPHAGDGPWQRFRAVERALVRDFDDICGDTFCEGDYSNLQALRFRCSVQAATGLVEACAWTFTGSWAEVDADSGVVVVDARTWTCHAPLAPATPLEGLLQTLEQSAPLHRPLPGSSESIYDGLVGCVGISWRGAQVADQT